MITLQTQFAGLSLRNPIIISSSSLTSYAKNNQKLEQAGAGAIVLKSIFEEQIMLQADHHLDAYDNSPEAADYLSAYVRSHELSEHIALVKESKKLCTIPIIASINCFSTSEWIDFAQLMQEAGADALELNILSIQTDAYEKPGTLEQRYIDILSSVKKKITIPVIVKLGMHFTNPIALIHQLYANGAAAVVLFNRYYQPDIDIETCQYTSGSVFSYESELANGLRWTAIASSKIPQTDYAISGGVHNGDGVIKAILAGATAVEICSALYQQGDTLIGAMTTRINEWMKQKGYESIAEFKGKMNAATIEHANPFERTQFMKYYSDRK